MSELQGLLAGAGYPVTVAASIAACEWRKSLWNLAVSGPCALLDAVNGAILDVPELRALAETLLVEARAVAAAEGVALSDADLERVFASTEKTRANTNAMLQDLRRGAPTEIAFLNGAVARLAERHGLSAPTHAAVARLIAARERLGRGEA
jgi:2-dehydropantoate 2-reductase